MRATFLIGGGCFPFAVQVFNSGGQLSAEDAYIQVGCPGVHRDAALQLIR